MKNTIQTFAWFVSDNALEKSPLLSYTGDLYHALMQAGRTGSPGREERREHLQTRELGLDKRLCVLMECRRRQKNCLHCAKSGEMKVLTHVKGMAVKAQPSFALCTFPCRAPSSSGDWWRKTFLLGSDRNRVSGEIFYAHWQWQWA